ncbi:MAG TPA: AraC family transcriptional regulator [Steroidobacteraceae bacterium]|nr:AraC family transcriptional regulator [Steroidobacteraceae bacterium]
MDRLSVFDEASVPRSTIIEVELTAPWCVSVPATDWSYCYVVRSGQCCLLTEDDSRPLQLGPGDVVSMVAGQAQTWRDSPQTPARPTLKSFAVAGNTLVQKRPKVAARNGSTRLLVMSAPRDSNRFVAIYPKLVAIPASEADSHDFLDRVIELIELESGTQRPGQDAVLRRLAELVVIELIRFALPRLPPGHATWLAGLADPQIARALAAMHRQPGHDWTLQRLARQIGMSRAAFVDRFRRVTGEPPHQHLRRLRLHAAAADLKRGDRSIAQIASAVGYRSESAFNKAFAQELGATPARYRRLHRLT